jgi:hypothetical protein
MSNFSHLEKMFPVLYDGITSAEKQVCTDPLYAVYLIRGFGEVTAKELLIKNEEQLKPPTDFYNHVEFLKKNRSRLGIKYWVVKSLNDIRYRGNKLKHELVGISEAISLLEKAFEVSKWLCAYKNDKVSFSTLKFINPCQTVQSNSTLMKASPQMEKVLKNEAREYWQSFWKDCHTRFNSLGLNCEFNSAKNFYLELKSPAFISDKISDADANIKIQLVCGVAKKHLKVNIVVSGKEHERFMSDFNLWTKKRGKVELQSNLLQNWHQEDPNKKSTKTLCAIEKYDEIDPDNEDFRAGAFDWYARQLNGLNSFFGELMQ